MDNNNINYAKLSKIANIATKHAQNTYVMHGEESEMFLNAKKRAERLIKILQQIDKATPVNGKRSVSVDNTSIFMRLQDYVDFCNLK